MTSNITQLKKIKVNHFRGLKNIEINLGDRLTVICGKNGTSKSTILGMIAQIFNFDLCTRQISQNPYPIRVLPS
ncbi:AAA family ATPase [Acinetobacter baumannii]|uniref:AAA family ATPase n=1 Tax=Acinetobacter baumannii TaxID=470 RepID=UPI001E2A7A00|nr:AAA family ATPase [Acinetobacter baumannii]MCD9937369.1 ATP-binding protein [Acinetobacter baumannii]